MAFLSWWSPHSHHTFVTYLVLSQHAWQQTSAIIIINNYLHSHMRVIINRPDYVLQYPMSGCQGLVSVQCNVSSIYHRADGEATIGQLSVFVSFGNLSSYHSKWSVWSSAALGVGVLGPDQGHLPWSEISRMGNWSIMCHPIQDQICWAVRRCRIILFLMWTFVRDRQI